MRSYAIGDIHGHLDQLKAAHERIAADRAVTGDAEAPVVHVGDLCDRGPDSRGVIEHLVTGIAEGRPWVALKGNHDRMFALFLKDPALKDPMMRADLDWLHPRVGGTATMHSYNVATEGAGPGAVHARAMHLVPPAHRDFLAGLPDHFRRGEAYFVHAGIRPGIALGDQVEDDLCWIRAPFLEDPRDHGALIVHGHTPVEEATHYGNRVNIDSGAGYGRPLSAVVIEGREVWKLTEKGRVRLSPPGP